jgi:hypothetical protein
VYSIPTAGGIASTSTAGALADPHGAVHQALAFTGFAFGAYVVVALLLIAVGLVLRILAHRGQPAEID